MYEAGEYIFHYGDEGATFYVILEGQVGIEMPFNLEDEEFVPDTLVEVSALGQGHAFGELSLLKEQPRSASIHCKTMVHLATLTKKDYWDILS